MANSTFFNARCKALEANLLTYEQFVVLAECRSVEECVKYLNERKLLQGLPVVEYKDLLNIVDREIQNFLIFIKQTSPNGTYKNYFLVDYDYFNVESLYLASRLSLENVATKFEGNLKVETIKQFIKTNNYKFLSPELQGAIKYCEQLFNENKQTGFLIDTAFKKALQKEKLQLSLKNRFLKDINIFNIDIINIELALRFRDINIFKPLMLDGGSFELSFFQKLCEADFKDILRDTKFHPYKSPIELIITAISQNKPLIKFEQLADCYPISYFEKMKYDFSGDIPYLRYCFMKLNEITNFKIVFEGLAHGLDSRVIQNEIRRAYAK